MPMTWRSGNNSAEYAEGDSVGRIVERRNENDTVGDVKVGVAGRKSLAFEYDGARHRQLDDVEALRHPGQTRHCSRRRLSASGS